MKKKQKFNKTEILIVSAVIGVLLCLMFSTSIVRAGSTLWDRIADTAGRILGDRLADKVGEVELLPLGAIPGTSIDSNIFTIGGVEFGHVKVGLNASSSVLCNMKNPHGATSTIDMITFYTTGSFTADEPFDISTTTTLYAIATSTPAFVHNKTLTGLHTNTIWYPRISTTTKSSDDAGHTHEISDSVYIDASYLFLAPDEYVSVKVATGTPGSETLTGNCTLSTRRMYNR